MDVEGEVEGHADPLASTSAFDTIELVIVGGRAVPRAELAAH